MATREEDQVRLLATVLGTISYVVRASVEEPGQIAVHCSCPYFESTAPCKHRWAGFAQAEQRGLLHAVGPGSDPIEVTDLEDRLSYQVDVVTTGGLSPYLRDQVLAQGPSLVGMNTPDPRVCLQHVNRSRMPAAAAQGMFG